MASFDDLSSLDDGAKAHEAIYGQQPRHHSSWTHELLAGGAGFAAMKAYEEYVRSTGKQLSNAEMKEMLASLAAAEIDKLFEDYGIDFLDKEAAKARSVAQAHKHAHEKYGSDGVFCAE
ncbi:unnamed protein product [Rotaria sp. Silwood1]|nr:unnamed protein product [Rotaria sp. Silwood1]CAF1639665.1 unnamed protein product [Rotaria sp. Silwood1]